MRVQMQACVQSVVQYEGFAAQHTHRLARACEETGVLGATWVRAKPSSSVPRCHHQGRHPCRPEITKEPIINNLLLGYR